MPMDEYINFLLLIPGIGANKAKLLVEAGYHNIEELREASFEELAAIKGIGPTLAKNIKAYVDIKIEKEKRGPELYLCPICGAFVGEDADTCPKCGTYMGGDDEEEGLEAAGEGEPELEEEIFKDSKEPDRDGHWYREDGDSIYLCPVCGAFVGKDDKICSTCGADISEDVEEVAEESIEEELFAEKEDRLEDGHWYKERDNIYLCPTCGAFVGKGEEMCPHCGTAIAEEGPVEGGIEEEFFTEQEKPMEDGFWYKEEVNPNICPVCGAFVNTEDNICQHCGTDVVEEAKRRSSVRLEEVKAAEPEDSLEIFMCSKCGAFIGHYVSECPYCGTDVTPQVLEPVPSRSQPKPKQAAATEAE